MQVVRLVIFTFCQICCKKSVKFAQLFLGRSHNEKNERDILAKKGGRRSFCKFCGAKRFAFPLSSCYNLVMKETYLEALDEFFAAHYSDYIKLAALEGYRRPELLTVDRDGNIGRKDSSFLRLSYQEECAKLMETLKAGLTDTAFSFSFRPRTFREKWHDLFDKNTFAKHLPSILAHSGETTESAGKKLSVLPEAWQGIVKGKYYPEKNTVLGLPHAPAGYQRPSGAFGLFLRPFEREGCGRRIPFGARALQPRDAGQVPSRVPYRLSSHCGRGVKSSPQIFPFGKSSRREKRNYSLRHGCAVPFRSKGEAKALFLIRAVKCRCKTLDGKRAGVLKYLQLNEESRCGGKSTAPSP